MVRGVLLLLISLSFTAPALTAPISLSQKDVAELILKQGPATQEVTFKYEQEILPYMTALANLDWTLKLESGFQRSRSETLSRIGDFTDENYLTTASINKSLITGTELTLSATRNSYKTNLSSSERPPQLNQDLLGLEVEQALWNNSFGWGHRALINQAESTYQATLGLRANELENVVLEGLRQFWNTYVSQESFRSAMAARDRYDRLVAAVRKKSNLGYANPGELSQAQAEYEGQVQSVKKSSTNYLGQLDILITSLGLPPGSDVTFSVSRDIPPLPQLKIVALDQLRSIRAQELKAKAAEEALSLAKSSEKPTLNLVAKASTSGVDESSGAAYSEMTSMNKPTYYAGLRFEYKFGSGVLDANIQAKRAAVSLEQTRLKLTRAQERDKALQAERLAGASFAIAQSAMKQQQFREKAVNELNRTYNQGRTDIRTLIENMNQLYTAEVAAIRALGDYQIALNEWAALRDELIPTPNQEDVR